MAGTLQIDPRPFTLRELFWMYESCQIARWDHTAFLIASQASEKTHPWKLNPYRKQKKSRGNLSEESIEAWHDSLVAQGKVDASE